MRVGKEKKGGKSADEFVERQWRQTRAATARSQARGVWGMPPENFVKMKAVGAFWGHSGA